MSARTNYFNQKVIYPKTYFPLILILFLFGANHSNAQLSPGDIAFTGYNSDNPDQFSFIATTDIPGGEVIYFTDRGYSDEIPGWINTSEGIKKYTSPVNGLEQGDIIVLNSDGGWHIIQGAGSFEDIAGAGSFSLAGGGDQIFAFQTNDPEYNPQTFIAGIHYNINSFTNESNWDNIGITGETSESDLPDELTNGANAIWVYGTYSTSGNKFTRENAKYNNTITVGDQNNILNNTNNHLNWELDNNTYFTLGYPTTTTSANSNDWNEVATWDNGIPGKITDVTIAHDVTVTATCQVDEAIINPAGSLNINSGVEFACSSLSVESNATQSASLINEGTFNGEVAYKRNLSGGRWFLVSSPVTGQAISGFLTNTENDIPQNGASRGMMDYNTSSDSWNNYFTDATIGNLEPGEGYCLRRETAGTVTFNGDLVNSAVNVAVSDAGNKWNLVGNPYPSAVNANTDADAVNNFLSVNSSNLDPNYTALYLWDEEAGYAEGEYVIINNVESESQSIEQDYIQAAQGFFVKAANEATSMRFTPEMRANKSDVPFKSGNKKWPEILIKAESDSQVATTRLYFYESMHKGLDIGYDAGAFTTSSKLTLATRLAEDNGVDFAIQCLPEDFTETWQIPLIITSNKLKEITFLAQLNAWPEEIEVFIGDQINGVFQNLCDAGTNYHTSLNGEEINRFTLWVGKNLTKNKIENLSNMDILLVPKEEKLLISGLRNSNTSINIYTIFGKKVASYTISHQENCKLDFKEQSSGIYLIQVKNHYEVFSKKIMWIK